ncbi:MAG: FAD-binding oxidoreductase [Deltaproteobacteria bacterium]|nr:MAG: FAD-binding oxidoreductase [Deltaproteobacteria bacterium]
MLIVINRERVMKVENELAVEAKFEKNFAYKITMLLIDYRWIFVVPIVLPLSYFLTKIWDFRDWYYYKFKSHPELHEKRVQAIRDQILNWRNSGSSELLCTSRKWWQSISSRTTSYKKKENSIEVKLFDILDVDFEKQTIRVEPLVNIGRLLKYLNPKGWSVPVVPELYDLTVSGLILGYGIEASSHKHGLFYDLATAIEVMTADGTVVRATPDNEHKDLYYSLPWSYGAMGFIVAVELKIIPIKSWVKVTYHPFKTLAAITDKFTALSTAKNPTDFVEGIMYDKDRGVIIEGQMVDAPSGTINRQGLWFKPWFYKYCETIREEHTEFVPLKHFYRRHNKSIFWEGELIIPFGNHPIFRWLLGWLMPPKVAFLKLTQGEKIKQYYEDMHVIQECLVPMTKLTKTIEFCDSNFDCYPVWLCPHKVLNTTPQGTLSPEDKSGPSQMFVDVGIWYAPRAVLRGEPFNVRQATKNFEQYLIENHGYQALYAVTELNREDYNKMFDRTLYDAVRKKYNAIGTFMDSYDKVKR